MIKIVTVDDHKIFRDGIIALLSAEDGMQVVGDVEGEQPLFEFLAKEKVDVVLMDINMRHSNGIQVTARLKREKPDIKVLAFSMHNQVDYVIQMLEAGASGYLLKDAGKEEMIRAIKVVASGDSYYSSEIAMLILQALNKKNEPAEERNSVLTKREIEVLKLIANEYSNPEIAEKLHISVRTVDTHRRNLLEKLQVKNTAGLVKYAIKNGMLK